MSGNVGQNGFMVHDGELRPCRLSVDVHRQLRELIVQGELAPHSVLSQAALARTLGVSRGPVREAFRRLQEQGPITAEPDQRPRVAGFDPSSLDSLYGARITLGPSAPASPRRRARQSSSSACTS